MPSQISSSPKCLYLESEDPDKEIFFYLNTPGGHVSSGLAIYDTMQYIKSPVSRSAWGRRPAWSPAPGRWPEREAICAASFENPDSPAVRRISGAGNGHRYPGAGDPEAEGGSESDPV